ncbi:MAG: nickel pincer cofactor biosynthesis protein LarC [Myxococcota bacterium]
MTHIHIDMVGGIAGDMFLAASIDAGLVTPEELSELFGHLGMGEIVVHAERVKRGGIMGTHIEFAGWDASEERDHRHLDEILKLLDASSLPGSVRAIAQEMFLTVGRAEAEVHGVPLDHVHFHELGGIDSILDFVGAAYVLDKVGATWSHGVVPQGRGTIETAHGPMPAMAMATARLLEGFELELSRVHGEMVTPTGATILRCMPKIDSGAMPAGLRLGRVGNGAGTKDFQSAPNVARFAIYETSAPGLKRDVVARITAEIDDASPEILAHVADVLLAEGALDVTQTPVMMKKGRLGTQMSVLCARARADEFAQAVLLHTSTFGVKIEHIERLKLGREHREVETPFGVVRVKVGLGVSGEPVKVAPEYEDCAARAKESGVPVRRVYDAALLAAGTILGGVS